MKTPEEIFDKELSDSGLMLNESSFIRPYIINSISEAISQERARILAAMEEALNEWRSEPFSELALMRLVEKIDKLKLKIQNP